MKRLLGLALALYLPHLLDEALTGMHDDPLIVAAYAPLTHLGPRHAAYLVFQVTLALGLGATFLFACGGRARLAVMGVLGLALLAEAHHAVRALGTLSYDSGLVTSLPLPFLGALVVHHVIAARRILACSTTSSSPWASAASSSGSRPSSPRGRARASSASPGSTTPRPRA
jgi:hypothetical protein